MQEVTRSLDFRPIQQLTLSAPATLGRNRIGREIKSKQSNKPLTRLEPAAGAGGGGLRDTRIQRLVCLARLLRDGVQTRVARTKTTIDHNTALQREREREPNRRSVASTGTLISVVVVILICTCSGRSTVET